MERSAPSPRSRSLLAPRPCWQLDRLLAGPRAGGFARLCLCGRARERASHERDGRRARRETRQPGARLGAWLAGIWIPSCRFDYHPASVQQHQRSLSRTGSRNKSQAGDLAVSDPCVCVVRERLRPASCRDSPGRAMLVSSVSGRIRAQGTRTRARSIRREGNGDSRPAGGKGGKGSEVSNCDGYGRGRRTASPHASTELDRAEFEDDRVRCRKAAEGDSKIMIPIAWRGGRPWERT